MNKLIPVYHKTFLLAILCSAVISCKQESRNDKPVLIKKDTVQRKDAPNPYATYDQSPMDMSYYPPEYPILKMNGTDTAALLARVIYSRPQKKGRVIFGYDPRKCLREYGKEWRLGANEATEIEFFRDVYISGKKVNKGRYVIYCIPYPDKWTVLLNTNLYTWGLHMDPSKDIFQTEVPVAEQSPILEDFTMVFQPAASGTDLLMAWGNFKVLLPIKTTP